MVTIETVKIVCDTLPMGYMVINKCKYNPKEHTLFKEKQEGSRAQSKQEQLFASMSVKQLKEVCKQQGVEYTSKKKAIEALEGLQVDPE